MKLDRNTFKLKIVDVNAGWMLIEYEILNQVYRFDMSCYSTETFDCLLEAAYYFNGNNDDPNEVDGSPNANCYSYYRYTDTNGKEIYLDDLPENEENELRKKYTFAYEGALRMIFEWDEEPGSCKWIIERLNRYDVAESDLRISISNEEMSTTFDIGYRDYCYAVVKAYNDYLLKGGFIGFHYGSYFYEISVHKFLYLKAMILDRMDLIERINVGDKCCKPSDIHKEIELLLMEL